MTTTVKERLIQYLKHKGLSQRRFERICGLSNGYVNNIKQSISPNKLQNVAQQFDDLNTGWLMTGEGFMLKDEKLAQQFTRIINTKGIPYYDIDFIKNFDLIQKQPIENPPNYMIDFEPFNDIDWWINVTGHSMEPYICHGDIIAIKKIKNWKKFLLFGEVYAIVTAEFRTIRIITQADDDNHLRLIPLNKEGGYTVQDIPKSNILQVFAVYGNMKRRI